MKYLNLSHKKIVQMFFPDSKHLKKTLHKQIIFNTFLKKGCDFYCIFVVKCMTL